MKTTLLILLCLYVPLHLSAQCNPYEQQNVWYESWESCQTSPNPAIPSTTNHWIQYNFDKIQKVDSIHLWNYNVDSAEVNKGVKKFDVFTSIDSLVWIARGSYTAAPATGSTTYLGEGFEVFEPIDVKYLLLNLEDNHGGTCTGISEIRIGIDSETCKEFQPEVKIDYELCDQQFELKAIALDPTANYNFKWSTNETASSISVQTAGTYGLIIDDGTCTKSFEINLKEPSLILNGWSKDTLIPNGQYLSNQTISTSGKITLDNKVQFLLNGTLELIEDFQVSEDGILEVHLVDCETAGSHLIPKSVLTSNNSKFEDQDYLGNGHTNGISAVSSGTNDAHTTLTGLGPLKEESSYRFLTQSTFGATSSMIDEIRTSGIEAWIDWQVEVPHESYFNHLFFIIKYNQPGILYWTNWHRTWWHNVLTGEEYLRDRMAYALSQILVISSKSFILNFGDGLTAYYDILSKYAFGNYRDLLYEVSLNPMMGFYLSHMNNPKTDASINQFPDENYAREILQLFSIGLYELNIDGSRKKDAAGKDIPTYNNNDIIEFAKIFTGLGTKGRPFGMPVNLVVNKDIKSYMTEPMVMHEDQHEQGVKHLLNGFTVPNGQSGLKDINDAIDNIFNHPNVGPFIGRQLIQRFVKSNPTPAYVKRVAEVFNDNGSGVRGDLKVVIKAVLLDPEARDCSWIEDTDHGKLKEPLLRFTQLFNSFNISSTNDAFYSEGLSIEESTAQGPLRSPSVFNFYQTDYSPPGILSDAMLDAPEFQILNSSTAIGYINMLDSMVVQGNPLSLEQGAVSSLNFTKELELVNNHPALVDHLNTKLTNGTLKSSTINTVIKALDQLPNNKPSEKINMAVYLIASSPEYIILK